MRAALVTLVVAAATWTAPTAHAAAGGDFTLRPLRGADVPARERFYIVRTVAPGSRVEDAVVAENLTGEPLELVVEAVDAVITADGAFAPLAPGRRSAAGGWIDVPVAPLRLAPHASTSVPLTIRVPAGAPAGEHFAAVTVRRPAPTPGSGGLAVAERVAVRVYLTVPGPAVPSVPDFAIRRFRFVGTGDAPVFVVEVENLGTTAVEPYGTVALDGPRRLRTELPVLGTVPAGERRTLRFGVPGPLEPGRYRASVTLRPLAGGPSRRATTAFAVAAGRELAAGDRTRTPESARGSPGVAAAVAAVLLALVASLLAARGARRSPRR